MNPPWKTSEWMEETTDWIQDQLNALQFKLVGFIEQPHVRPWSTVLKIPTDSGDLYFKATSKELEHEVALTLELKRYFPEIIPDIMAFDIGRGWMIMRDGGTPLRAILRDEPSLKRWEEVLPIYAGLQIQLIESVERLLELGAPDRRLTVFPALLDHLLDDVEILYLDQADGLSPLDRVRIRSGNAPELCSRLLEYGIPETLDHGDFHDGNIFVNQSGYVFFDWGDSSVSHPFFSLRTAFVSLEYTLHLGEGAPEFTRLTEIYLENWERYDDRRRLREAFDLARRLWAISSALRWQLVVSPLSGDQRHPYVDAVPSLLEEYLDANPELI